MKNKKKILIPDLYYSSFWKIDFNRISNEGIENLIIDVDGTIAKSDSLESDPRADKVLSDIISCGIIKKACIVSNTIFKKKEPRVWQIAKKLNLPYVTAGFLDRKPKDVPFLKGLKIMEAKPENTAVIGDQIFTDILGGNRLGMFTVLVKPLGSTHWATKIILRRFRERRILKKFNVQLDDKN